MYLYDKNRITYFAETDRRNKCVPFGIKAEDRTRHMYIIGKTGMGKSTLIENMAVQDIKNGEGFAFIDPHGKSASLLLEYIPPERVKDVIYFAPFDMEYPISLNVLEDVGPEKRHLIANGLMSTFKKIWGPETWSARMEYILGNTLLALLEYPGATLLAVNRLLTDKVYRKKVVDNITDPSVRAYWVDEFTKYSETYTKEATPAIQNKIGQFTSNPLIRNIIGQPVSSFDFREVMDNRKILIINLSKGQLGEGNANLLGGMIITKLYLSAMSRADLTERELNRLPNFSMYVDEFQSFANESFADILSEARKYKLSLVIAHQYVDQMDEKVRSAVFGNVGTSISFRVGPFDAEILEKEYMPVFTAEDFVSLGRFQMYIKLMIDGVASHPFSATTLPPITPPEQSSKEEVIASSRDLYARPRKDVEKAITDWYTEGQTPIPKTPATSEKKTEGVSRTSTPPRIQPHREKAHASKRETPQKRTVQNEEPATEKPFAEAFKHITPHKKPAPSQKQESPSHVPRQEISLKDIPKGTAPSSQNKDSLKSALADILDKEPKKPAPAHRNPIKPPLKQIKKNIPEKIEPKERAVPVQVEKKNVVSPRAMEHDTPPEKRPVAREVPEDVLTAILRGED